MNSEPFFTIFIPAYNRADLLPRAFASIEAQKFTDFEVLIIDDGSTDRTRDVINRWQDRIDIPIRYHWQENRGKPSAHNAALDIVRGEFTVILDSDDALAPDALQILKKHWDAIPPEKRPSFAGVEGLCAYMGDGKIAGSRFPSDIIDSNYLEIRHRYKVTGDKKNAIRSDVLRQYPFPLFENEKDLRESIIWSRMAHRYRFRYINEVIQLIEYQTGGLSSRSVSRRARSPHGFRLAFKEMLNDHAGYCSKRELKGYARRYIRCSLHGGVGFRQQALDLNNKLIWLTALPGGIIGWLKDRFVLWREETEKKRSV